MRSCDDVCGLSCESEQKGRLSTGTTHLCGMCVGMLACWGALGRRLNLVVNMYKYMYLVRVPIQRRRGAGRQQDNACWVGCRSRALA
jgi:hypothetical protein